MGILSEHAKFAYLIREDILWRKLRVMYLYPPPDARIDKIRDLVSKGVDRKFQTVVKEHLKAFMVEGIEPPAAIASTIKNFADDLAAGRDIAVRTGDYLAVQGFTQKPA